VCGCSRRGRRRGKNRLKAAVLKCGSGLCCGGSLGVVTAHATYEPRCLHATIIMEYKNQESEAVIFYV